MAFQVSPGVAVAEVDLTTRVPIPSISAGGFAGPFTWGPLEEVRTISSENDLVTVFGKPDGNTYKSFFTAAGFLTYGNNLKIVRTGNTSSRNAVSNGTAVLIQNDKKYENTYKTTTTSGTNWAAKYPGDRGNSLKVSICMADRANTKVSSDGTVTLASNTDLALTGTIDASGGSTTITGTGSAFDFELRIGDVVKYGDNTGIVTAITNSTSITVVQGDDTTGLGGASAISSGSLVRFKRSAFEEPAKNMLGTIALSAGSNTVSGTNTLFTNQLTAGDILTFTDSTSQTIKRKVASITSDTALTFTETVPRAVSGATFSRQWEFKDDFVNPPLTSPYAYNRSTNKDVRDEIHVVVVDEDGAISGTKDVRGSVSGTTKSVLEIYPEVSVANGATGSTGETIYYKDYINENSDLIRWMDHDAVGDTNTVNSIDVTAAWGEIVEEANATFEFCGAFGADGAANGVITESFSGGNDGTQLTDSDYIGAYSYLKEPSKVDVSLLMSGDASNAVASYLIGEVAEYRKDCVVFLSPQETDVVNKEGSEVTNIVARRNTFGSTSYGVMDGNYKWMFDRYNGVYRYVPLNGDIAGLCARSDAQAPFISPAGFNRGQISPTAERLAFTPSQAERDDLYVNGVNPVVTFPGQGKVLYGDKTLLAKPSAFDRINVRRLFIALEKAIANAAQFSLFEFNDAFTRANFVSLVDPFLRQIQSSRAIQSYKVVCDESNNTPAVIDSNQFRGDIFIKPARSINFIQLNFVAVASGVEFSEVAGAV